MRHYPIGAELLSEGVHFRVWAPSRKRVEVVLSSGTFELQREESGYFSGLVPGVKPGETYRFRLDGRKSYPDPASRFQPEGPHGPSQVIDSRSFAWTDLHWKGIRPEDAIVYEMHIGTFTPEGTWRAASEQLVELSRLGVTLLEVMPVADFPGRFGWGYDGVNQFAPTRLYGSPDDFRRFVNLAHSLGMGVILDVVYNHFGPDGNYLREFSDDYFSKRYYNDWGEPINFDDRGSEGVREFFVTNARYWIEEFHLDGMRFDATQQIFDSSSENIHALISKTVRGAVPNRTLFLVAENEMHESKFARPIPNGHGFDSIWNEDFHRASFVATTGRAEGYFRDFRGTAQELVSTAKYGFLFQGQHYLWGKHARGTPAFDLPKTAFVNFLENHDQVSNHPFARRFWQLTSPARYRAMSAFLLLSPGIPMLFQGQEFASSKPFHFFADHSGKLAEGVYSGRSRFFEQIHHWSTPELHQQVPRPEAISTFDDCRLDFSERVKNAPIFALYRDLIALRKSDPVLSNSRVDGAVLASKAILLRYFGSTGEDRLFLVNLENDLPFESLSEPLFSPPMGRDWNLLWSSDSIRYGGSGRLLRESSGNWRIPAEIAVLLG